MLKKERTTYPVGPLSYTRTVQALKEAMVADDGMKAAFRTELDVHSVFTWEKFLAEGVDAHFLCRIEGEADRIVHAGVASDYWTQLSYYAPTNDLTGRFTVPSGMRIVALYSRNAFKYPVISATTIWPDITGFPDRTDLWIGFENGAAGRIGLIAFRLYRIAGVEYFRAFLRGMYPDTVEADLAFALPGDFHTGLHSYAIELTRNLVVWRIDAVPVAYGLMGVDVNPAIIGPPYAIIGCPGQPARDQQALLEGCTFGQVLEWVLSPKSYVIAGGDRCPPRVFRLYDAGTNNLFAGLSIAAGSETSHPVPILGYAEKTFHFRANQNGDIDVEVLTQAGNWRIYAPDAGGHTDSNYTAGELWSYIMTGDAVLARLTFTPDAYPCTITDAEVVLN